jgi:hypothetical protein
MENKNITKRLTRDSNYSRPKKTYQDNLSPDEIKKKLEEYKKINDITKVDLNTHLRYFIIDKTGNKQFRLGGFLNKIDKDLKYVILSNGKFSWSVQIDDSIFFQKVTFGELKLELIHEISNKYLLQIKKLKEENDKLKIVLKEIKKRLKK